MFCLVFIDTANPRPGSAWGSIRLDVKTYGYPRSLELGMIFGMGMDFTVWRGLAIVVESNGSVNMFPSTPKWSNSGSFLILDGRISAGVAYTFPSSNNSP